MHSQRSPETILQDIAAIRVMERGKISEIRRAGGKVYYNLQFWTAGKNRCEYVPAKHVDEVRQALANHSRYRELVEEYATVVERNTRQARRDSERCEKRGSAKRRPPRPPRR